MRWRAADGFPDRQARGPKGLWSLHGRIGRVNHESTRTETFRRRYVAVMAAAVAALLVAAVTACSAPEPLPEGDAMPDAAASGALLPSATPSEPTEAPETARLKGVMQAALKAAGSKPQQESVRSALVAAGIPEDAVEVSVSKTPTGLEVDAVEAAVSSGTECVVGETRNGRAFVTVLPLLADGKCFVGDAR